MPFDPAAYKASTRAQWDGVARDWNAWGGLLDRWLGPATETLLDMCHIEMGSHVLHVAGGSGQEALQTARRVGPSGRVVSTDISEALTELARSNFARAGVSWAEAHVMDGEDIAVDGEFDAVISRVGLIFFPDQLGSVRAQRAVLKPGGCVGALVYATPAECGFFSDPVAVIRRHAGLAPPAPGTPSPFSLGQPGDVEALFDAAGLSDVRVRKIEAPVFLDSAKDCLRFEKESFGALHQMLDGLDHEAKEAAWAEVEEVLRAFEQNGRFEGPCTMIAVCGRR